MPVEITGGLGRRKGLGEELSWGWFAPGSFDSQDEPFGRTQGEPFGWTQGKPFGAQGNLKPRPPEEWRRADPPFANITFRFEACEKFAAEVLRTSPVKTTGVQTPDLIGCPQNDKRRTE